MTFEKLSAKHKKIFRWCYKDEYKAIICDGAVRSGDLRHMRQDGAVC